MFSLQASWTPDGGLFFWTPDDRWEEAMLREVPALRDKGVRRSRLLVKPDEDSGRKYTPGVEIAVQVASATLALLPAAARVSDSVRCWSQVALLALELAAGHRVVPSVDEKGARWRALLSRADDLSRFELLVAAMPNASRAIPDPGDRGDLKLIPMRHVVRQFLDDVVDGTYRTGAYPGSARGWELQFAEALRADNAAFAPRDARFQGVPAMLQAWVGEAEAATLRVGLTLRLPTTENGPFALEPWLHPVHDPERAVSVDVAWKGGAALQIAGQEHEHPAHAVVRGLGRAARIFPPLGECLAGKRPRALTWDAQQVWDFLHHGQEPLRDAGFTISLPEAFEKAGRQRIRARIFVIADLSPDAPLELGDALHFRWEVVLGDRVIDGNEFAALCAAREPVVKFRGDWVLLDPAEVARLPDGLPREGTLPSAVALRAILAGEYEGVPVVADDQLEAVLRALRDPPTEPLPPGFLATLRPYQQHGYDWLTTLGRVGLGACLADDMGLGKTVQAIAHLLRRRRHAKGPSLVACPTSVLSNWEDEFARFAPSVRVVRYHGLAREEEDLTRADVVLTTYGLISRDQEVLGAIPWDVVVLDEAQAIKNPDSQRARAARLLKARHRVALTGTPVENRLEELWSLMEFLNPGLLGPRGRFRTDVALPIERFGDQATAEALRKGIAPFLLRRLKTDPTIIDDLPDKIEKRVYCPLTREQEDLYQRVLEEHLEGITASQGIERRGQVLAMLTALKQVCNHPAHYLGEPGPLADRSGKLDATIELLDAIFDNGERAIVFTQYREMGDRLQAHLAAIYGERAPFLHGGVSIGARAAMVRAFQEDDDAPPVLLVSLRAGGTGLNLTRATHVLHYDRWWNPAVEDQATDRAYRIGQRHNVLVHKLVTEGTLEERIDRLLEEKRELADQVMSGGEGWVTELDNDALRALVTLATSEARA